MARFSSLLEDGISVGDEISLTGPYGSFTLKQGHVLPVVFIGGGAGMAPILSLLRHMNETGNTRQVHFYYGARTAQDLFYLDEILAAREGPDGLHVRRLLLGVDGPAAVRSDHLRGGQRHRRRAPATKRRSRKTEVYLCGPPPMVDAALDLLEADSTPRTRSSTTASPARLRVAAVGYHLPRFTDQNREMR